MEGKKNWDLQKENYVDWLDQIAIGICSLHSNSIDEVNEVNTENQENIAALTLSKRYLLGWNENNSHMLHLFDGSFHIPLYYVHTKHSIFND